MARHLPAWTFVMLALGPVVGSAGAAPLGVIEAASCSAIEGWVVDPQAPTAAVAVQVRLLAAGRVIETLRGTADRDRPELTPLFGPSDAQERPEGDAEGVTWTVSHGFLVVPGPAGATARSTDTPTLVELSACDGRGRWWPLAVAVLSQQPEPGRRLTDLKLHAMLDTSSDELVALASFQPVPAPDAAGSGTSYRIEIWGQAGDWETTTEQGLDGARQEARARVALGDHAMIRDLVRRSSTALVALWVKDGSTGGAEALAGAAEVMVSPWEASSK